MTILLLQQQLKGEDKTLSTIAWGTLGLPKMEYPEKIICWPSSLQAPQPPVAHHDSSQLKGEDKTLSTIPWGTLGLP